MASSPSADSSTRPTPSRRRRRVMPRSRMAAAGRRSPSATRSRRGSPAPTFPPPARSTRCTRSDTAPSGLVWGAASPSAHVTRDAYERIVGEMLARLQQRGPVDGVYLDLHGAMVTEHLDDGEGELLRARARQSSGTRVPVVASLDLHANVTRAMMQHADGLRRVSHLSARRHGGDRRARRAAARTHAGAPARRSAKSHAAARLPHRPVVAVHVHRAGASVSTNCSSVSSASIDCRAVVHARLSDGRFSGMRDGGLRLRPRRSRACRRAVDALAHADRRRRAATSRWSSSSPTTRCARAMQRGEPGAPVVLADTQDNPGRGRQRRHHRPAGGAAGQRDARDAGAGPADRSAPRRDRRTRVGLGRTRRIHAGRNFRRAGHVPLEGEFKVDAARRRRASPAPARCSAGFNMELGPMAVLRTGRRARRARVEEGARPRTRKCSATSASSRVQQRILALKSSVHFRADFQPIATRGAGRRRARTGQGRSHDVPLDAAAPRTAPEAARARVRTGLSADDAPPLRHRARSSTRPTRSLRSPTPLTSFGHGNGPAFGDGGARALRAHQHADGARISTSRGARTRRDRDAGRRRIVAVEQGVARDVRDAGAAAGGRGARRLRRRVPRPARRDGDRGLRRCRGRDRRSACAESRPSCRSR